MLPPGNGLQGTLLEGCIMRAGKTEIHPTGDKPEKNCTEGEAGAVFESQVAAHHVIRREEEVQRALMEGRALEAKTWAGANLTRVGWARAKQGAGGFSEHFL